MIPNDADIEMAEAAAAANLAASTRRNRAFDPDKDGPGLAAAVRDAVTYLHPIYEVAATHAADQGFAYDDDAANYAYDVAFKVKAELDRKERAEGRPW